MEHIRQAVELAKARSGSIPKPPASESPNPSRQDSSSSIGPGDRTAVERNAVEREDDERKDGNRADANMVALDPEHLEALRVIGHNVLDQRSRSYDMLRTVLLSATAAKGWQLVAVTSPTAGCGKTLTAVNLAMSISRQQDKSAFLVDLDLQRPQVAKTLGLKPKQGLFGVLEGQMTLPDAVLRARIGNNHVSVLPCEKSTSHSSEWMTSNEMGSLLQDIRKTYCRSQIAIVDLPPILTGDDVISILPQLDCVILVTAVGVSTMSDIERCKRHLQSTEVVRVVLNKSAESGAEYYYY